MTTNPCAVLSVEEEQNILARIHDPRIPSAEVNVRDFGAVGDGVTLDTQAIQRAIAHLHGLGGGRVVVPAGRYLTGSLALLSHINLHLDSPQSVLLFTTETTEAHYPLAFGHWECSPLWNYRALIYACDAQNIALTGRGVLDGQASDSVWWNWTHQIEHAWSTSARNLQRPASLRLREMNLSGVPVAEWRFGDGHYLRPMFIQTLRCQNVLLEGVTLRNSPMWQVNPVMCRNVTVRRMTLRSHGHNNDGVDPESCCDVLIEDNLFDSGDDCIAIKSGRDRDGREANIPCENIIIRNNRFADGHGGIALGSEMSGGIRNVFAVGNEFDSPALTYPLRLKANALRGGVIENIWLRHSRVKRVRDAVVHATMNYAEGVYGNHLPRFRNIVIEDLEASGGEYGLFIEGLAQSPIEGLVLKDIRITDVDHPLHAAHWGGGVKMENVTINGLAYPRPVQLFIRGLPQVGDYLRAIAQLPGDDEAVLRYSWWLGKTAEGPMTPLGEGDILALTPTMAGRFVRCRVNHGEMSLLSKPWLIQPEGSIDLASANSVNSGILRARGVIDEEGGAECITRFELAQMIVRLWGLQYQPSNGIVIQDIAPDSVWYPGIAALIQRGMMALVQGKFLPDRPIRREEAATVAMMSCGVSYRNASTMLQSTFTDGRILRDIYLTNAQRAVAFGFMRCDEEGRFRPRRYLRRNEALEMLLMMGHFMGDQDAPQRQVKPLC